MRSESPVAENTAIEWTESTWTPIRARRFVSEAEAGWPERIGWHCEPASPGCKRCYAEEINLRLGTGRDFKAAHLKHTTPLGDERGDVDVFLDEAMLLRPLRWRRGREIFVCSMTDLFADFVSDDMIDRVFAVMALCPQHTFQVLTKRADRMQRYMTHNDGFGRWGYIDGRARQILRAFNGREIPAGKILIGPLPHVHLGVSIEDQRRNDERLPALKATPAARRFVSFEPLLEAITADLTGIDLAIIGGESGRRARDCCTAWVASLIEQARATGCAPFVKQLGARAVLPSDGSEVQLSLRLKNAKGGDMAEWPPALRVRERPAITLTRLKAAEDERREPSLFPPT